MTNQPKPPADTTPAVSAYPEHDKMEAVKDRAQAIGEFIDWLHDRTDYALMYDQDHPSPVDSSTIERLLAQHFNIDLEAIEAEKRAMLAQLRAANGM